MTTTFLFQVAEQKVMITKIMINIRIEQALEEENSYYDGYMIEEVNVILSIGIYKRPLIFYYYFENQRVYAPLAQVVKRNNLPIYYFNNKSKLLLQHILYCTIITRIKSYNYNTINRILKQHKYVIDVQNNTSMQ